uniref:DUF4371 domain-containing protein n=1 Tax=Oryzias latipes TaxID=8090 RepID=A0A3P9LKJ5_ORYLA
MEVQEDVAYVIANSSKETPPQSCETRHQREKSTAKVKRKYHSDYIHFGFFWTGEEEDPKPHCVLCYETLANEAMKPAILKRDLETKHKEYQGKPIGFFERKREELKKHMMKETSQFFAPGENAKDTEASYKVPLLIAKAGKPHSIGENLVKPAAKVMANILFGGKSGDEINRILLSNDTFQRGIKAMAESVKLQLVTRLRQSQFFSLQLDESIDMGNEANLLCFVRYIYAVDSIFHSLNDFIVKNNLDWSRCVGICTDGATTMTGKQKGLVACVRAVAPSAAATHCWIHREQLAVKKMPQCLKSVLDESVKIANKIKAKPLNSRLFKAVCEEMGSEDTKLLFHTEVCWLSRGKVLTRLFELRDEVMLFLHHSDELYDRMHDFQWLAKLAYLADIFSTLNTLNVALQGKTVTIFNVQDKIKATRLQMELWCGRLDRREFDSFPTLADFLLAQFTSKLSPRQVDSFVDIASDGTLKTTFREKGLTDFWLHIQPEHPQLADSALKLLMPFPTTYNCEVGFSTVVGLKTKQRNRISVDYDMRLKLSSLEPDIASIMAQKKQHHSSH